MIIVTTIVDNIINVTKNDFYGLALTFITIGLIIITMYNRIKYLCLEKAVEKIATVEELKDLTGEQKFSLVVVWICSDLPSVFSSTLVQALIKKIIDYAYENCFKYANNYIERKTGCNIKELINMIKSAEDEADKNNMNLSL